MSDLELKRKESLTKAEVAKRLSAFAKALAGGDDVELEMGGTSMSLRVPDDVRVEFEVEVDGDEIEIEIELKWSRSPPPTAQRRAARGKEHGGAREQQAEPARLRRTEDRASPPRPTAGRSTRCRCRVRPGSGEQALARGFPLLESLFDPDQLLVGGGEAVDVADEPGEVGPVVVRPGPVGTGYLGVLHVDEGLQERGEGPPPHAGGTPRGLALAHPGGGAAGGQPAGARA